MKILMDTWIKFSGKGRRSTAAYRPNIKKQNKQVTKNSD